MQTTSEVYHIDRIQDNNAQLKENFCRLSCLQVIQTLLEAGADVERQLRIKMYNISGRRIYAAIVTPLTLAVYCGFWQAVDILLQNNASWNAVADHELYKDSKSDEDNVDRCSMENVLETPCYRSLLQCVTKSGRYKYLKRAFQEWKDRHPDVDVGQHDYCDDPEVWNDASEEYDDR